MKGREVERPTGYQGGKTSEGKSSKALSARNKVETGKGGIKRQGMEEVRRRSTVGWGKPDV